MGKEIKRIAVVRKTNSLENDDRLRKEIASIRKINPQIEFKIFVMLDDNKDVESETSFGIPYKAVHLNSREKYPSGSHLVAKTMEFYRKVKHDIRDYDALWVSGLSVAPFLLLVNGMPRLWDLRELPLEYMGSFAKNTLLRLFFKRSKVLLHGNQERVDYLISKGLINNTQKHLIIRNFPNFNEVDSVYDERFEEVKKWIAGRKCVYLQGLNDEGRAPKETIDAIMRIPELCAIVLGRFNEGVLKSLVNEYGDEFHSRICLAGNFPVLKIPQYMKLCDLSMVFYKNVEMNNWLCEPNRLYQSINLGLPVIVGENPTMKNLVACGNYGVVAHTDGKDVDKIVEALNMLLLDYKKYKAEVDRQNNNLIWTNQEDTLRKALDILEKNN